MFRSSRVQLRIIPCVDGRSSPQATLERIKDFVAEFELSDGDELWLLVDRDRWTDSMLGRVAQDCIFSGINFAVSHPCFEVWLALHLTEDVSEFTDSQESLRLMRALLPGYSKDKVSPELFLPRVGDAVIRAQRLDICPEHRWPLQIGTRVYLLVNSVMSAMK
jgi:hypothetical protein